MLGLCGPFECQLAFRTLINQLADEPVLAHPQINNTYYLYTDAAFIYST